MGALSLVGGAAITPTNASKDGHWVRFKVRDSAGPTSPFASPFQSGAANAGLVISSAQLLAAAPRGPLRRLFNAANQFVPPLTAAPTQAQARALLDGRDPSPSVPTVLTSGRVPRARITITPAYYRTTEAKPVNRNWTTDVSVDGSGNPTIIVRANFHRNTVATPVSPYTCPNDVFIDIQFCHSLNGR